MSELSLNTLKDSPTTDSIATYVNKLKRNGHSKTETDLVNLSFSESKNENLIDKINKRTAANQYWFSLEFFPPKTINGAANLIQKLENLGSGNPLFCDITWHPAGDPSNLEKPTSSMKMAAVMLHYCLLETMLHITCYNQTKDTMKTYLDRAKSLGIRNLLALRGDPAVGTEWKYQENGFNYAVDLVRFIKQNYDDYFVICVSGYPTGHPDSTYEEDLNHLKEKVDAGADFIITQLFFKPETFINFVKDCRKLGIKCPIIPGILPVQSFDSLRHICKLSKLDIPCDVISTLETIKDNDEAIRKYGIDSAVELCKALLNSGLVNGLHFYTLNREVASTEILRQLGLWSSESCRNLPWRHSSNNGCSLRKSEDVRPIFWSIRPKSYVCRTSDWDQFPNGRWGNSSAPSFGDLKDYHIFYTNKINTKEILSQLGEELNDEKDIWHVFECFVSGKPNKQGVKVTNFPWCEEALAPETNIVVDQLCKYNKMGILTNNSQPNVNGAPSADSIIGWGSPDGYVYQKAYLEFFTSSENLPFLLKALEKYPRVNYHIISKTEEINLTNCKTQQPNAVTWGVFPGQEIIQPTVVDPISFLSWKDEAFNIWEERWGNLYEPESKSRRLIERVVNTYVLVNLVDNDYQKENCIWSILDDMFEMKKSNSIN